MSNPMVAHSGRQTHDRSMNPVFRALSDPSRRLLLDRLMVQSGQSLRELGAGLDMTRQSVRKHLAVLEEANLVSVVKSGRESLHYLNAAPIADIADRWISRYHQPRVRILADLKHELENTPMDTPDFVYTTYIKTTPEQLWQALTDPVFTERYWGCRFFSDWRAGSTYAMEQAGIRVEDDGQRVVESDPPRRLSYMWHTFSPEWVDAVGRSHFTDEQLARMTAEPRSTVTFDIEPSDDGFVKLTVRHSGLEPGGVTAGGISEGWPRVLAGLKTLLETPEPASTGAGRA